MQLTTHIKFMRSRLREDLYNISNIKLSSGKIWDSSIKLTWETYWDSNTTYSGKAHIISKSKLESQYVLYIAC